MRNFDKYHYYGLESPSKGFITLTAKDLTMYHCKDVSECNKNATSSTGACCGIVYVEGNKMASRCLKKHKYNDVKLSGVHYSVKGCPEGMM